MPSSWTPSWYRTRRPPPPGARTASSFWGYSSWATVGSIATSAGDSENKASAAAAFSAAACDGDGRRIVRRSPGSHWTSSPTSAMSTRSVFSAAMRRGGWRSAAAVASAASISGCRRRGIVALWRTCTMICAVVRCGALPGVGEHGGIVVFHSWPRARMGNARLVVKNNVRFCCRN